MKFNTPSSKSGKPECLKIHYFSFKAYTHPQSVIVAIFYNWLCVGTCCSHNNKQNWWRSQRSCKFLYKKWFIKFSYFEKLMCMKISYCCGVYIQAFLLCTYFDRDLVENSLWHTFENYYSLLSLWHDVNHRNDSRL